MELECISPEDIAAKVGLRAELLNLSCEENCFVSLSDFVDPWRLVFADLLSSLDLKDIDTENRGASEQEKRVASLRKWKSRNGADATYRVIIQSAIKCGHVDNAEAICRQLLSQASKLEGLLQSPPSSRDSIPGTPPTSGIQTVGEPSNGLSIVIDQLDEECVEIEQLVFQTIKRRKVPLEDVLNWIRCLPMTLKAQFGSLIQAQAKTLTSVSSVDELSYILTPYWNALHPALLEYLVKKLRDEALKARMDRFMIELQRFRIQTTLGDFLDKWVGEIPPGYQEYILELGERWRERTVEDFEKFRIRLSRSQIVVGGHMSFMKTAKSSSILVILALPKHLFPLNLRQKDVHVFLRDEDVLRVMVDGQCVLDLKELVECEAQLFEKCSKKGSDISEIARLLNQPGLDPNIYDEEGLSLLWWACYLNRTDVVTLLLDNGANVDLPTDEEIGESPLIIASYHGNIAVCKVLIERGATIDYQDKDGCTSLYLASRRGHKEVVELLLDRGASVDKPNMGAGATALRVASGYGHAEVAGVLIARGAAVDYQDEDGNTPFQLACLKGHLDVAQTLIFNRANINHTDKDNQSALHLASGYGQSGVVKLLVKSGAQLDIQNTYGNTALGLASMEGQKHTVDILIKAKANPDIQNRDGLTALMGATDRGHKDVVELLLAGNANPNITDTATGRSAIFMASEQGNLKILKLLVKGGADVDLKDKNNQTPLDIAQIHNQDKVYKVLLKYSSSSEARKDITEEQKERAKTFTKRLRKIFDNLEWIFLRSRVLKEVEQSSREFPSLSAESAQQQAPSQRLSGTKKKFMTSGHSQSIGSRPV